MSIASLESLFACDQAEIEWWYYHGHLASGQRKFGFHLAFFRSQTDSFRLPHLLGYRWAGSHMRFAHFSLTELDRRAFHYGHQRSLRDNAGAASDHYSVWLGDWFARGAEDCHSIGASIRGVRLDALLHPQKQPIAHGSNGALRDAPETTDRYVSYPRLTVDGMLTLNDTPLHVVGDAWMDRESGRFAAGGEVIGWDWFGIQLNDCRELLIYRMRNQDKQQTRHSIATLVEADGRVRHINANQIELAPLDSWTSPRTGNVYPLNWRISIPVISADLQVRPFMPCHELDTRGSTSVIYWEGPAAVEGLLHGKRVEGRSYVELVGYDRRPRRLGVMDFTTMRLGLLGGISNELRLALRGPGVRVCDAG